MINLEKALSKHYRRVVIDKTAACEIITHAGPVKSSHEIQDKLKTTAAQAEEALVAELSKLGKPDQVLVLQHQPRVMSYLNHQDGSEGHYAFVRACVVSQRDDEKPTDIEVAKQTNDDLAAAMRDLADSNRELARAIRDSK